MDFKLSLEQESKTYGFLSFVSKLSALSTVPHCFLPWSLELAWPVQVRLSSAACAHFSLLMALTPWWYLFFSLLNQNVTSEFLRHILQIHRCQHINKTYFPLFPSWKPVFSVTFSCGKKFLSQSSVNPLYYSAKK